MNELAIVRLEKLLRAARLELKGIRRRGNSAIAQLRKEFSFVGTDREIVDAAQWTMNHKEWYLTK